MASQQRPTLPPSGNPVKSVRVPTVGSGHRDNNTRHPTSGQFVKTQKAQINYTNQGEQVINKKGPTWG